MSIIDRPSKKQLDAWMKQHVAKEDERSKEELSPEQQKKITELMDFFARHGITFDKFDPKNFSVFDKKSYPNYDQYSYVPGQHDIKKWLMAVKNIQYKQKAGFTYKEAIQESTKGWKHMEVYDFLNWLKYYEEGAHMKYKFAQAWYANDSLPGYFLEVKKDTQKADESLVDFEAAQQETQRNEEKKQIIADQRKKILSRLDSIRKMLRSEDGRTFAGDELEILLEAIHTLEKKISTLNKLSTSIRLYEDMIIREANVLHRKGFSKAADMLHSVAQTPGASAQGAEGQELGGAVPIAASPPQPDGAGQTGSSGAINESPGGVGVPNPQSPSGGAETTPESKSLGISQFMDAMNGTDELDINDSEDVIMVEAQAMPPKPPAAVLEDIPLTDDPAPVRGNPADLPQDAFVGKAPAIKIPIEEPLEVTEDDIIPKQEDNIEVEHKESDIESKIDAVMADATIEDIVSELEDLAKTYRVREIARRFARVDDMLNAKGLGSVFANTMSEIQNRNFDSGNYISSRLEDILSKLRGALPTKSIDLEGRTQEPAPEVSKIKSKLEQDAEKEKHRKQMRKQQEAAELEPAKETPDVEMGELEAPIITTKPKQLA